MHHHHHRRRKKRSNYGTRTFEVSRGHNGFGFTISGQQPCILSCIVKNSPADRAGLRAGDFLISVNNLNVSKLPHEAVVQLIGNSFGNIRMQIAENYFSDSSEEENVHNVSRGKPSYLHHKLKMNRMRNSPQKIRVGLIGGSESLCNDMKDQRSLGPVMEDIPLPGYSKNVLTADALLATENASYLANENPQSKDISNVSAMVRVNTTDNGDTGVSLEYRAIVGYLGTIEMPKQIAISSKLQTVRSCIRKLRQEKRNPTTVLMTILPSCLTLQNSNAVVLATYPSSRLNYVSSSSENENRFFSLVTSVIHSTNVEDDDDDESTGCASNLASGGGGAARNQNLAISNSCHVFVVDTKICDHHMHEQKASEFRITCTKDPISNLCLEFPNNSEYVVNLIRSMYTMRILPPAVRNPGNSRNIDGPNGNYNHAGPAHSPQPSNHSEVTTTSSNSDSGIGFYNDYTNISDRILIVDFPGIQMVANNFASGEPRQFATFNNINRKQCLPSALIESLSIVENGVPRSPKYVKNSRLRVRAMPDPKSPAMKSNTDPINSSNLLSNLNLNNSSSANLVTTRSCDDVLSLFDRQKEKIDRRRSVQMSVDDISIHSTIQKLQNVHEEVKYPEEIAISPKEHTFLQPAKCISKPKISKESYKYFKDIKPKNDKAKLKEKIKLNPKAYKETNTSNIPSSIFPRSFECNGEIDERYRSTEGAQFETWSSLQDVYNLSNFEPHSSSDMETTFSAPDLSTRSALLNASQNRRWVQSSFRTPRAAEKQNLLVRRSTSLTVSENDAYDNCMDTSVDSKAISQEISKNKGCVQDNQNVVVSQPQEQVAGVTAWGSSFEKLLEDAAGLHAFSEFLKKEFSAENIYFWTACERFKHIESDNERAAQATTIFAKHLANNAPEPVNVDSQARILAEESLRTAGKDMFRHAQKQIFNLMKFDSYQRFIRSDLYKRCVEAEEKNQPLPFLAEDLDELLRTDVCSASNLKKSASNAEDRRRKSLLPWHRKARCKSRDRGECDIRRGKLVTSASSLKMTYPNSGSDIHSSRSSLSSFDTLPQCGGGGGGLLVNDQLSNDIKACSLCRVILNDGATTIVQTRPGETISQLIEKLLEKRGISYHFYDVVINGSTKSIDINNSALYLAGKEVFVEQRVAFKLDLPDPKVISVKSKPKKQLCDVIRPILQKYNYTMERVQVLLRDTHEPVDLSQPVTVADGKRLQIVELKNVVYNDYQNQLHKTTQSMSKSVPYPSNKLNQNITTGVPQNTLDEITNKVFNELLQGKVNAHNHHKSSDIGSLKSDECASETSSIFGRLRKRDSNIPGLKALRVKKVNKSTINQPDDNMSIITHTTTGSNYNALMVGTKKPIIAKLKAGVKLQVTERAAENQDEFLEGLKRAQCARLEDQRGTEINSELPEFLKNKENMTAANKLRKIRANLNCVSKTLNSSSISNSEDQMEQQHSPMDRPQPAPRLSIAKCKINISSEHLEQENFSNCDNVAFNYNVCEAADIRPSKGPPPLPPKPKILPIKPSNWGQCGGDTIKTGAPTISLPSKIPIDINRKHIGSEQTGRNAYLDEPSSSFV